MATPRGKQIPVAQWWVEEAFAWIETDPRGIPTVGRLLAEHAGRKTAYSRSLMSRILRSEANITLEWAEAVSKLYGMPPAVFLPRSREESLDLDRKSMEYAVGDPTREEAHKARVAKIRARGMPAQNLETVKQAEERIAEHAKRAAARRARRS